MHWIHGVEDTLSNGRTDSDVQSEMRILVVVDVR